MPLGWSVCLLGVALFIARGESGPFTLRLRVDRACSSDRMASEWLTEVFLGASPAGISSGISSDPEEMVIIVGQLIVGLCVGLLVRTISTLFRPSTALGNVIGVGKLQSSAASGMDPFTPFHLVAQGCMGVGVGTMSERDLMLLSSIALVAGCFPPPTCFLMHVLARLGRHASPSRSIFPL